MHNRTISEQMNLEGRVSIITGGCGLMGTHHAASLAELGSNIVLLDVNSTKLESQASTLSKHQGIECIGLNVDITNLKSVETAREEILNRFGRIDVLVNNAANNPAVSEDGLETPSRLENLPQDAWESDIAVGLTGAYYCSRIFGTEMSKQGSGSIINIASDLALIAPDQRLYQVPGREPEEQPVKPVTYSVVKAGLVGLTRYLATYWSSQGVRANALVPGGIQTNQPEVFLDRISDLIPLGRMAAPDEYRSAIAFLASDASSYMTGATLVMDGGRTCW